MDYVSLLVCCCVFGWDRCEYPGDEDNYDDEGYSVHNEYHDSAQYSGDDGGQDECRGHVQYGNDDKLTVERAVRHPQDKDVWSHRSGNYR